MWMQKEASSIFCVSKTTAGTAVFAPWGMVRRLPGFGLCCFLSFHCMNSPKIHINSTFSLGLKQVMNNKSKQQLPSTVPVKFHVPYPKGLWLFFSQLFPSAVWNVVGHLESVSCSVASLADWDGAVINWITSDGRWAEVTWNGTPNDTALCDITLQCWAAEGTCLPKFRSLWSSDITRDTQGKGGTPRVWVRGGAGQDWQNPYNASPGEGWLHFFFCLGSAAKCCTFLWLSWLQVSVGSELQVCSSALALISQGLQRCHKVAWCALLGTFHSWSTAAISLSISSFILIVVHDWKSDRGSTVKIKMVLVHIFPNAAPHPLQLVYYSL